MHKRIFCNNSQQMLECRYQASSLKLLAVYDCGLSITSKGLQITVHKGKGSFVLHKSVSSLLVSITILIYGSFVQLTSSCFQKKRLVIPALWNLVTDRYRSISNF